MVQLIRQSPFLLLEAELFLLVFLMLQQHYDAVVLVKESITIAVLLEFHPNHDSFNLCCNFTTSLVDLLVGISYAYRIQHSLTIQPCQREDQRSTPMNSLSLARSWTLARFPLPIEHIIRRTPTPLRGHAGQSPFSHTLIRDISRIFCGSKDHLARHD